MKRFFLLLLAFHAFSVMFATSLEDKYVMKTTDKGQLYFILPFDIPSQNAKTKPLSADITYLTTNDYVTINISVLHPAELVTDSLVFLGENHFASNDFQTFFIEKEGKLWLHRYSMRVPWITFNQLFGQPSAFVLVVYAKEETVTYSFTDKKWRKEQEWINQILHIINSNKRIYK